jgi:ubiquinone/menaquinone biosynthesis C-methylase UbiE
MIRIAEYKTSFGNVARVYKKYRGDYKPALFKKLLSIAPHKKGEMLRVLDLGCGVGNSTEPLLQMAQKLKIPIIITGCDLDGRMLKEARKSARENKLPLTYVEAPAEHLPFKKDEFDFVISGAAFHWFATKKAMREVQRVLDTNGMYAVFWSQSIPAKNIVLEKDIYKKYNWHGVPRGLREPKRTREVFEKSGFRKIQLHAIPNTDTRTVAEAVGLAKTNSSFAVLSAADKKSFEHELTREFEKALGKRTYVRHEIFNICHGTKPAI